MAKRSKKNSSKKIHSSHQRKKSKETLKVSSKTKRQLNRTAAPYKRQILHNTINQERIQPMHLRRTVVNDYFIDSLLSDEQNSNHEDLGCGDVSPRKIVRKEKVSQIEEIDALRIHSTQSATALSVSKSNKNLEGHSNCSYNVNKCRDLELRRGSNDLDKSQSKSLYDENETILRLRNRGARKSSRKHSFNRKQNSKSKCTDSQNNTENTSKLQNNNFSLNAVYDVREDNDSNRCEYDLDTDIRNKNINSSRFEYVIDTIVINDSIDDQLYETENSNNVERNNNQCETEVTMPMVTGDKPSEDLTTKNRTPSPNNLETEVINLDNSQEESHQLLNTTKNPDELDDVIVLDDTTMDAENQSEENKINENVKESNDSPPVKKTRLDNSVLYVEDEVIEIDDDDDDNIQALTENHLLKKRKRHKRILHFPFLVEKPKFTKSISMANTNFSKASTPVWTTMNLQTTMNIQSALKKNLNVHGNDYYMLRKRKERNSWLTDDDEAKSYSCEPSDVSNKQGLLAIVHEKKPNEEAENGNESSLKAVKQDSSESVTSEFGNNLYNPHTVVKKGLRTIVIDGSNVALGHTNGRYFSVKGLKICIDYFRSMGHTVKAFVPQFRLQSGECSDPKLLKQLNKEGVVIFTPSRMVQGKRITPYDDRMFLRYAAEIDAVVVSNDNFRDIMWLEPALVKVIKENILMWTFADDVLIFPNDPKGRYGPSLKEFLRFS